MVLPSTYMTQLTCDAMHHRNQSKLSGSPDAPWDANIHSNPDDEDAAHFTATTEDLIEWGHVSVNYTFDFSNVPILSEFTSSGHSTTSWHLSTDTSHTQKGKFPRAWLRGTTAGDEVGEHWRVSVLPPKAEIFKISLSPSTCIIVTYVMTCSPGSNEFIGT